MTDVLKVIKEYIPIETCEVMVPTDEIEHPIHNELLEILGPDPDIVIKRERRFEFYREVKSENTCFAIATGDGAIWQYSHRDWKCKTGITMIYYTWH